jgi:hypothetical protein
MFNVDCKISRVSVFIYFVFILNVSTNVFHFHVMLNSLMLSLLLVLDQSFTRNSSIVDTTAANMQICDLTFPVVSQNYKWCVHYPEEWMCLLDTSYFWYPWDCYFDLQMKLHSRNMSSRLWLTVTSNHTELLVSLNWINAVLPYLYVSLLCVLCIDRIHMRSVVSAYTCCISRIKQILIKFCIGIHANYP